MGLVLFLLPVIILEYYDLSCMTSLKMLVLMFFLIIIVWHWHLSLSHVLVDDLPILLGCLGVVLFPYVVVNMLECSQLVITCWVMCDGDQFSDYKYIQTSELKLLSIHMN